MNPAQHLKVLIRRAQLHSAYKEVFTGSGEDVLIDICKRGFVFDTTFVAGDPYQTALNEGSRRLALSILKFTKKDHREMLKAIEQIREESES